MYVNAAHQVSIAKVGGITAIVSGMNANRDHVGVQEQGYRALANLAVNAANKVLIVETGGITAIVRGVKAHLNQADVQKYGCRAVANLAVTQDDNRLVIAKVGGITAIVSDMKAHNHHVGVQEWGCLALYNLSANAIIAAFIAVCGGVQVLGAVSTYPYAEEALDKIRAASIPNKKLPSDSAKNREAHVQEPDEEPANEPNEEPTNGRNRSVCRIWKSIKCIFKIYEFCEDCQEIEEE